MKIPEQLMVDDSSHQISLLLIDRSKRDECALERLLPLVYDELRRMARNYRRRQPSGHDFQTTELIHEAFLDYLLILRNLLLVAFGDEEKNLRSA